MLTMSGIWPRLSSPRALGLRFACPKRNQRNISFEEVVLAIEADGLLDILQHPNSDKYPHQLIFVVAFERYVYLVPFVEESEYYFLKTIIPSRKAT